MHRLPKVLVLGGPTCVGKSDLAIKLSKLLDGELISCDSVQVYANLSIGCNKPSPSQLMQVPHHLIGHVDLASQYTAADFHDDCMQKMKEIVARGKTPVLVGGSGFYLRWIFFGRPSAPPSDPEIRQYYEDLVKEDDNWEFSLIRLEKIDPEYAATVIKHDYYRLVRALTVNKMTGQNMSMFKAVESKPLYDFRCFYLTMPRPTLYDLIDTRCKEMLQRGLLLEVLDLMETNPECAASQAIGYRQAIKFLTDLKSNALEDVFEGFIAYFQDFQAKTRQYARKQDVYFFPEKKFKFICKFPEENLLRRVSELFEMEAEAFEEAASAVSADTMKMTRRSSKTHHYMRYHTPKTTFDRQEAYHILKPVCERLLMNLNAEPSAELE